MPSSCSGSPYVPSTGNSSLPHSLLLFSMYLICPGYLVCRDFVPPPTGPYHPWLSSFYSSQDQGVNLLLSLLNIFPLLQININPFLGGLTADIASPIVTRARSSR